MSVAPGQFADYVVTWDYTVIPRPAGIASIVVAGPCGKVSEDTPGSLFFTNGYPDDGALFRTTLSPDACLGVYRINASVRNTDTGEIVTGWSEFTVGYAPPPAVPDEQTLGCGNETGTADTTVMASDPVNTATGAACDRFIDAAVPAAGVPFTFCSHVQLEVSRPIRIEAGRRVPDSGDRRTAGGFGLSQPRR